MSQFYDDNNEVNIYYPVNSPQTYNLEEDFENLQIITPLIENQINNLSDLTHQYNFNIYSPFISDFILDELEYINNNYFYLHNFDTIVENDIQSRIIFSYLYELITSDLILKIIPKILDDNDLNIDDLLLIDIDELKYYIIKCIQNQIELFNGIKEEKTEKYEITDFEYNQLKYTFYLDLFDSDLESFKNKVLDMLVLKYKDSILAYTSN